MSPADLAIFAAQLRGAVASAEKRGLRIIGYEWNDGHLRYSTAPIRRERKPPPQREPERRRVSRGVGGGQGTLL